MNGVIHGLFSNATLRRVLFKTRFLLALALLVPLARYMDPEWLLPGFAISMAGQLIQTWCFASLVKNRELTMRGPYLIARNPMYLGRFFLMLGFVCLLANWVAVVIYAVIYYAYMVHRVQREERRLKHAFGEEYAAYCRDVRRFLPSLLRLGRREVWFFDWQMFLENHAHWNLLLTLGAYGALAVFQHYLFR